MQTTQQQTVVKEIKKVVSSNSISTVNSEQTGSNSYKKYTKITEDIKDQFLNLIINQNCSIKKAAEELNINYSSAKTIISVYREKNRKKFKGPSRFHKRSLFRPVAQADSQISRSMLVTSIGGIEVTSSPVLIGKSKFIKKLKVVAIIRPDYSS